MTSRQPQPPNQQPLQRLQQFVAQHPKLLLLTGAGLSTESGIGDYRDENGQYKRPPPMTISEFLATPAARQRYWARSLFGWPAFAAAQPNVGHKALAQLQAAGYFGGGLITQNVDSLHQQAGHRSVVALHGQLETVVCLGCAARFARAQWQAELLASNPQFKAQQVELRPDGDAELVGDDLSRMVVPDCTRCGGIVKPNVVFFGDSVPRAVVDACYAQVAAADALLVIGSSVMVFSSFRFCRKAHASGLPLAAVNLGQTRADDMLRFKLQEPIGPTLAALAGALV